MFWWTMRRLKSADPKTRARAAEKLGESHEARAVAPLEAALGDEDTAVRAAAAEALGNIGDPRVTRPLAGALLDKEPEVRAAAAGALGRRGPVYQLAIAAGIRQEGPRAGALGIAFLKGLRKDTVTQLLAAVGDPDGRVRAAAAVALGEIWNQQPVRAIREALHHDLSPATQALIIFIHSELPDAGDEIVQRLRAALGDTDADVRAAAAGALRKLEKH